MSSTSLSARVQSYVSSTTPLTRYLAATLISVYLLGLAFPPSVDDFFSLVPGKALSMGSLWQIGTSAFVHRDPLTLVGHLATIFVLCPTLEPIYGKAELSKTILVAILISNMLTVVCIYFIYAVLVGTGSDLAADILFRPIRGFYAGTAALLVALKQAIPDSEVTLLRVYHCRASDLAGIYILLIFVIGIITNTTLRLLPLAAFGTLGAWFYLRYFCCRPNSGIKGDPSDAFKFSTFLPTAVRPFADSLGSFLARAVKLDAPTEGSGSTSDMESVTSRLLNMETSSKHDIEAARRRERGIRALDETMAGQGAQKHEEEESAAKSTNIADGAVPAGNSEESA